MNVLTEEVIASFKDAARKLTGPKRRAFQAQVTLDYLDGSVWNAERVFGWSHHTVTLGLNELRTGITCLGNFSARGNHKTEEKWPELAAATASRVYQLRLPWLAAIPAHWEIRRNGRILSGIRFRHLNSGILLRRHRCVHAFPPSRNLVG